MKNFADRLNALVLERDSVLCLGLDPVLDRIPAPILDSTVGRHGLSFESASEAFLIFSTQLLEAVGPLAVAVKPQVAYFEKLGWPGMKAYAEVCLAAHRAGLIVIADVKRNDIGSTASAYASAWIAEQDSDAGPVRAWQADALTVNPYLGHDGIDPFVSEAQAHGTGLFVLVRTSNPSARQFQDLSAGGRPLYEHVAAWLASQADKLVGASGYSSLGAVVGATYPDELRALRALMPANLFLVPGYGAQGAGPDEVAPAFDRQGLGAVVNASRSIIFAHQKAPDSPWKDAARRAALDMRDQLNAVRKRK